MFGNPFFQYDQSFWQQFYPFYTKPTYSMDVTELASGPATGPSWDTLVQLLAPPQSYYEAPIFTPPMLPPGGVPYTPGTPPGEGYVPVGGVPTYTVDVTEVPEFPYEPPLPPLPPIEFPPYPEENTEPIILYPTPTYTVDVIGQPPEEETPPPPPEEPPPPQEEQPEPTILNPQPVFKVEVIGTPYPEEEQPPPEKEPPEPKKEKQPEPPPEPPPVPPALPPALPPSKNEGEVKLPLPPIPMPFGGGGGAPLPGNIPGAVGAEPIQSIFRLLYQASRVPTLGELLGYGLPGIPTSMRPS